jgi:hypothetical protein
MVDYSNPNRKRQSPFRGFRTGFGKATQILSKELFDSLPEGERTKKLVAFSDSREDAAKLAKKAIIILSSPKATQSPQVSLLIKNSMVY